ncbi:MAG: hybrid sensor histidine kinase/response regulator [Verrucomicrobiales bacterium]|nr:hybrid sensor histidine kinase/response regulator [Verrucomicrobiales bacterium]
MSPPPEPPPGAPTSRPNRQEEILTATGLAAERILHSELEPEAFNDALALLGRATGVSRVYVFATHSDSQGRRRASQKFEWCAPGIVPQIANPDLQDVDLIDSGFGRWLTELQANRAIFGPVASLPDLERPILEAQAILSVAVMPILTHGSIWGFIGFDDCTNAHSWTLDTVGCLRVAARVLGAAFERRDFKQRSETTLAELISAHQAAEAANRGKSEFLSTISHELRTPLNGILGLTESLLETKGEFEVERTRRYLGIIHDSGRQLLAQINDILDVARIEAGRIEARLELVNLGDACTAAAQAVSAEARRKSITLEVYPPPAPLVHAADARLLRHALQNLLANAVKFTPDAGRVEVRATPAPDGGALLTVSDTGIGIPAEELHKLFKPFSQVDSSLSRRHGGTGLGLLLVDRMVRLQGGRVHVDSTPDVGSRFTIELPALPHETRVPSHVDASVAPSPRSALVVGTDPHLHLVIGEFLRARGFEVHQATPEELTPDSPHAARTFGILFVDTLRAAPGRAGLAPLRALPHLERVPCVVILPSTAKPGTPLEVDAKTGRDAGAHAHLTRPLSLAELGQTVTRLTGLRV